LTWSNPEIGVVKSVKFGWSKLVKSDTQSKTIGEEKRNYRDREGEVLFMDLRQMGEPFEKKYIQFSEADIIKVH
ncbi:MAG: hypothetical protein ACLGGX_12455, partial [Bdellovibrionia bacterium]